MRAIRFETSGTAHVVDIPRPVPGPGEVLLAVTSTGVCGSDLAARSEGRRVGQECRSWRSPYS